MTNPADNAEILIDQQKYKKWQNSNTSDKTHVLKTLKEKKYMPGSEQRGAVLEKTRKYSKIDNSPFHLKKTTK